MKKLIALVLVLIFIGSAALAEVYVLATADPTWVRTSPGLGDNIVDKLVPNALYQWGGNISYDNRGVAWYDVWYGNSKYGWISSLHGNLIDTETGEQHVNHDVPLGNGTSIYANDDVNVRTGPGTEYGIIGELKKGESADYTGTSKKSSTGRLWYQINYYNNLGWVSASYTSIR